MFWCITIGPSVTKQKKNTDLTMFPHYFPFNQNKNVITKLAITQTFTKALPSNEWGILIWTHRMIGGFYSVCHWHGIRCCDIHTKFHKDWFSLHKISNDNGVRVVNSVTSKNLIVKSTIFPHCNFHKFTWTNPNWKMHNQIDHTLTGDGIQVYLMSNCSGQEFVILTTIWWW
jgi:hypothetical protein